MFDFMKKKLEDDKEKNSSKDSNENQDSEDQKIKTDGISNKPKLKDLKLVKALGKNVALIKQIMSDDATLITREFENPENKKVQCCLFYINGMCNVDIINKNIIRPIQENKIPEEEVNENLLKYIETKVIEASEIKEKKSLDEIIPSLLYGDTIVLLEGYDKALVIDTKGWKARSVSESNQEKTLRGPQEAFQETMLVNCSLLRRKFRSPDLKFVFKEVGIRTKTNCCVCYLESLADPQIIEELYNRLETIDIDGILDSGYIQEMIKDSPYTPFKTIGNTDRPDTVAGKLLEGRIALIVDGSPDVLTMPYIFLEYFQTNEDYYHNYYFGSIGRMIRIFGAFLTVSVPALYIALVNYQQELIPTPLLLSIAAAQQGTPFPSIVEALVMLFAFEMLREAGTRMPSAVGQAVSIVGALVLGQAAVEAKFISAPMIIIIALAGISALLIPKLKGASITFRIIFLLLAAFLGLYGLVFGFIGLFILLFSMRSFGVPYMLSLVLSDFQYNKDTVIRAPWWNMILRPKLIGVKNTIRKSETKFKEAN